ncbi:hypothetical protein AB205_0053650 [Aquarana catesbeiana]|uniref:Uncharacterized protein n=1 Tax=Aquarana catesbeiana TaxID=8400 RepID=A0A2G9RJ11_AQUCT|nr:hypothetical protein AB205_0053650 [Aquarana catesbeiana]
MSTISTISSKEIFEALYLLLDWELSCSGLSSAAGPKTPGSQCLNAFKKMVEEDLRNLRRKDRKGRHVWDAIKKIGERHEVVIRPADKGGGLVILDKKDYQEEMENLLRVENTYKKLKSNPKKKYQKKLKIFIEKGRKMGILNLLLACTC